MKKKIVIEYPTEDEQKICDFVFALAQLCNDFGFVSLGIEPVGVELDNGRKDIISNISDDMFFMNHEKGTNGRL